jgi:phosphomethylpyrimidine synthase
MSQARSNLDWEGMYLAAFNPEKAREIRRAASEEDMEVCTMCGDFCSAKINRECRGKYRQ